MRSVWMGVGKFYGVEGDVGVGGVDLGLSVSWMKEMCLLVFMWWLILRWLVSSKGLGVWGMVMF